MLHAQHRAIESTPLYDSCPLQHCSSSVLLPVSHNGSLDCVVGFHASGAAAFSEAEQATLEALAELIGLTVHSHFLALASLDAASPMPCCSSRGPSRRRSGL